LPILISTFLLPAFSAFILTAIITPLVIGLYRRRGWVDDPAKESRPKNTHSHPVPRGGGIPIFIALAIAGFFFLGADKHFLGILTAALILTLVGIADDIYDLSPYLRLLTTTVAALIVVGAGIGIAFITNPFGPPGSVIHLNTPQIPIFLFGKLRTIWVISDLFALVWILWMSNIVNWSKGLDGQMPGFVAIAAVFMGLFSLRFSSDVTQWEVTSLAAITAGAYAGFLLFNFFPQKIMPGYGGGTLAGFLLAILAILSGAKVAAMILILAIPTTDALASIIRRLYQGKSPVWGDRGHLHHHLLDSGWSRPQIALFYWAATFVLGLLSLKLNSAQKIFTIALAALITSGVLLWLKYLTQATRSHET